jgi:hypothetical protein
LENGFSHYRFHFSVRTGGWRAAQRGAAPLQGGMMNVHCDFCGLDFDPACIPKGCDGCPLARGCSRYTCPRCGYEILPEAKLVGLIKRIFEKKTNTMEKPV